MDNSLQLKAIRNWWRKNTRDKSSVKDRNAWKLVKNQIKL